MMETTEERNFIKEVIQNVKEDYDNLSNPTYCNVNVGFGSLKSGMNIIQDNHSIRMIQCDDLCSERINNIIKKFIQRSSIPSMMKGRSARCLNVVIGINILNDNNHYSGRFYEIELQKDGGLILIDVIKRIN